MSDIYNQTALTYPNTYRRELNGSTLKNILEDEADNIFKLDLSKISFPSLKFVPANLTTKGIDKFISFAASTTP